jgi:hypothetical protein
MYSKSNKCVFHAISVLFPCGTKYIERLGQNSKFPLATAKKKYQSHILDDQPRATAPMITDTQ